MSRICTLTLKRTISGNKISHSNNKTKRKFKINLVKKKYILPNNKKILVKISAKGIKIINKLGINYLLKIIKKNEKKEKKIISNYRIY